MKSRLPLPELFSATSRDTDPAGQRLYAQQVRLFIRVAPLGMAATVVNAAILAFVLRELVSPVALTVWLGAALLVTAVRVPLLSRPELSSPDPAVTARLGKWLVLGTGAVGLVWGAVPVFLFPPSLGHQVFIAFVIGGMIAGAAGTYNVIMPAFLAYSLPTVLPLIVRFLLLPDEIHIAMGIMAAVFIGLMVPIARRNQATIIDNFRLVFENRDLTAGLTDEKTKVEESNHRLLLEVAERVKAEETLQRSHAELEKEVAARTRELADANASMAAEIVERARVEDELRRTNELLERVFSTSFLKIAYMDREFNFIRVNEAYAAADERRPEEFPGRNHFDLYPSTENEAIFRKAAATGQRISFQAKPYAHASHPERGTTYWDWELIPIKGRNGQTKGLALFLIDVTERIRAERHLRQAHKMEAIGTLAGGIAHDFNNILNVIFGYTELAAHDLPPASPAAAKLAKVEAAGRRAGDLVRQILAFSKSGGEEVKTIRLQEVVADSVDLLRGTLPATIRIETEIDPGCRPVRCNRSQMQQVIMNLGTNAFHAMRRQGGALTVTLREVRVVAPEPGVELAPGPYAKLTMTDTGQGMDRETLERIFDPYFTTKGTGEGTGLGLAIVHGIVRSHGGAIRAESEPGRGATFEILLPVVAPEETAPAGAAQREQTAIRGRILFVDDEELIVELGRAMLEKAGCEVVAATRGRQALELFQADPAGFDLVITDQTMPELTGAELSRRLLAIRPGLPIILTTGFSELIDEIQAKELGIREFITKPYTFDEMAAAVRRALGKETAAKG
ncbi:MAG: response regulator [Desulfobacteraceae bacterium]|nr:response regulator [Desulfobacteraceae bacterium]